MDIIDLDRHFVPLAKDKDAELTWDSYSGRKYGGWLNWSDLLKQRRVALLAEALSGKTQELEYRARLLKQQGLPAFFVRIEGLTDRGFAAALHKDDVEAFELWKKAGLGDAWFFLDSVDEARLNGKWFSSALQTFGNELGSDNLNRSFVIVSCRVSDWMGKSDRMTFQNALPFQAVAETHTGQDPDEMLLAPIFNSERKTSDLIAKQRETCPSELLVVQLAPLSHEQKLRMAVAADIDGATFVESINLSGLDAMAERPGDLIELIGYWAEHKGFGSLRDMTEEGVRRKLREDNVYRSHAGGLSPERGMEGAQRLAAALVLGKTFSLKSPGQEPDPTLSRGAIDPSAVLNDWGQKEVNELLRTGLFSPSTYGRVKFHHRATQEYLAACWLRSMLDSNCPIAEIQQLLFAEPYGVKTAVPTLLAVTAWLSQWVPAIRDELIEREPVALIAHGDPKSLSLSVRESLLRSYARLDAAGELDYEYIDSRAAWMFSNPALAPAIKRAWNANANAGFRLHLLQFIEQGPIHACVDLARQAALDRSQDDYTRLVAARALIACQGDTGLKKLTNQIRSEPDRLSARLAPQLAQLLFPQHLSMLDLLQLIDRSEQAPPFSSFGFASHLATLHGHAETREAQKQLVAGIADLVLVRPRGEGLDEASKRHAELCNGIAELARAEMAQCANGEVDGGSLRLLMAVERTYWVHDDREATKVLRIRVRQDKLLNRQLMWADAATARTGLPKHDPPVYIYQVGPPTDRVLWGTDATDIDWLATDARAMPQENERRVAFSALCFAMHRNQHESTHSALLEELASHNPALRPDLAAFKAPVQQDEKPTAKQLAAEHKALKERELAKQSWVDLRNELTSDPGILDRPDSVTSWKGGLHRLFALTRWLKQSAAGEGKEGIAPSSFLRTAFGPDVATHYSAGMRQAWRHIEPERPIFKADNSFAVKYTSTLALDALNLDSQSTGWASDLSEGDTRSAIRHATMAGTIKTEWVAQLLRIRPAVVLPEIVARVQYEFRSEGRVSDIINHTAFDDTVARDAVSTKVFQLLKRTEPANKQLLQNCLRIIARGLDTLPNKDVLALVHKRLVEHLSAGDEDRALAYFRVLASADGEGLAKLVLAQLVRSTHESESDFETRVQRWIGALFDRHICNGAALIALKSMSVDSLAKFLHLAYRHVQSVDDRQPKADSTVTHRDLAEGARNALLTALMGRKGADAYAALAEMASISDFANHALRFRELAHRKAQSDSDIVPWTASEVYAFGRRYSAPAKTGMQLLRLTLAVLSDIARSLDSADASSRALLALADDEEKVQQWLAERLHERSNSRYHVHREAEVADRNEPDIVVASTSAPVQVTIEVKNANKGWTVQELENALKKQLAGDYLLTENRRHGILVVSLHKHRTWRVNGEVWDFDRLIAHLNSFAKGVTSNGTRAVEVRIFGINASRPTAGSARTKAFSVTGRTKKLAKNDRSQTGKQLPCK